MRQMDQNYLVGHELREECILSDNLNLTTKRSSMPQSSRHCQAVHFPSIMFMTFPTVYKTMPISDTQKLEGKTVPDTVVEGIPYI